MIAGICQWHTVGIGIPIGLIIGFQRIIQISETALGTSALSSSDGENSPRREALLQTIATIFTLFIAVVITSYVFSYGIQQLPEVKLSNSGFERIAGYLLTVKSVTGLFGTIVIISFFLVSGITTILGSFHFVNVSLHCSERRRSFIYLLLITTSGLISVANFDIIFDIVDLLMFIVSTIMIISLLKFLLLKPDHCLAQANIRINDDEKKIKHKKRIKL
jgi:Na+/alanine symporter